MSHQDYYGGGGGYGVPPPSIPQAMPYGGGQQQGYGGGGGGYGGYNAPPPANTGGYGGAGYEAKNNEQQKPGGNREIIENQVFITQLNTSSPPSVEDIKERFGSIGVIKMDKKTRGPRIKVWPEKGCASVTYEDPSAANAAISWFNDKDFKGSIIKVEFATKAEEWSGGSRGSGGFRGRGGRGGGGYGGRGRGGDRRGGRDDYGGGRRERSRSPQRNRGGQEGDWVCSECNNNNFARRDMCNRCKAPRPGGGGGGGYGGSGGGGYGGTGGYGRRDDRRDDRRDSYRRDDRNRSGGGGYDRRDSRGGGGRGGPRDGDWPCGSCGVNNFASRSQCFKCHEPK